MSWRNVERPGYSGSKKNEIHEKFDAKYGRGNWRLMWAWAGAVVPFENAVMLYEDGFYHDSYNREETWKQLLSEASDVYAFEESDIKSGVDYSIQKGSATHLHDIAIRRVAMRKGWKFEGEEPVQIISLKGKWGRTLSPGIVPFHLPEKIIEPHLHGWWRYNSIADFWQSNKVLQVDESR